MNYAIGDIHGCYNAFRELLEDVLAISKKDRIFLVGDLVCRGVDSLKVVEYVIAKKQEGYNIKCALGNHEYRIRYLYHNDYNMLEEYCERYCCTDLLQGELNEIISFFDQMPYYIELDDWIICHAELGVNNDYGPTDARYLFGERPFENLNRVAIQSKIQVYGHLVRDLNDIIMDSFMTSSRIGIDGGCVYPEYGYLCSLNMDTYLIDYVKNNSPNTAPNVNRGWLI